MCIIGILFANLLTRLITRGVRYTQKKMWTALMTAPAISEWGPSDPPIVRSSCIIHTIRMCRPMKLSTYSMELKATYPKCPLPIRVDSG